MLSGQMVWTTVVCLVLARASTMSTADLIDCTGESGSADSSDQSQCLWSYPGAIYIYFPFACLICSLIGFLPDLIARKYFHIWPCLSVCMCVTSLSRALNHHLSGLNMKGDFIYTYVFSSILRSIKRALHLVSYHPALTYFVLLNMKIFSRLKFVDKYVFLVKVLTNLGKP